MALRNPFNRGKEGMDIESPAMEVVRGVVNDVSEEANAGPHCYKGMMMRPFGVIILLVVLAGLGKLAMGYGFLPGFDFPAASTETW